MNIGKEVKEVEFEPIETPAPVEKPMAPVTPLVPEPEPEPVPV
jgi:hypothetical protein